MNDEALMARFADLYKAGDEVGLWALFVEARAQARVDGIKDMLPPV